MAIKYVDILNSFVSTEGFGGNMTNYIYYSLLVVSDTGARSIVEGRSYEIAQYLPYVRTSQDELQELKATVKELRGSIGQMLDEKMGCVVDSLYPIPDIAGVPEKEAVSRLQEAGLSPVMVNSYPDNVRRNGVVRSYKRHKENFRQVELDVIHALPKVEGLEEAEAAGILKEAGFTYTTRRSICTDQPSGIVLKCTRPAETALSAELLVSVAIPELKGMTAENASAAAEAAGIKVTPAYRFSSAPVGVVTDWVTEGEDSVRIFVSEGAETKEIAQVDMTWTNMQGSSGDVYFARATADFRARELNILTSYRINAQTKVKVTSLHCLCDDQPAKATLSEYPWMEPGKGGNYTVKIPFNAKPPKEVICILGVQYPGAKKEAEISQIYTFDW